MVAPASPTYEKGDFRRFEARHRYNTGMSLSSPPAAPITGHEGVVVCSVCASANLSVAAFCGSCGTRLLLFCWSCGTAAHAGQRYCQHCGCELLIPESALRSTTVEQAVPPLI